MDKIETEKKLNIIIISGPSGAGEDSIIKGLSKRFPIEMIITTTHREMRTGETQKNPYYFISEDEFMKRIKKGDFFEYACQYNGIHYGVTFEEIKRVQESGKIGIWKIEYKGVMSAKKLMPGIKAIFINAPLEILEQRIKRRDPNISEEYLKERAEYTKEWLKHRDIYDYEVNNEEGKLDESIEKIAKIIEKELGEAPLKE